jgi:hypothetical protein
MATDVPRSTAEISGSLRDDLRDRLTLWREDKSVVGAILPADDGTFTLSGLPAGQYCVGSALSYLYGTPALAEFDLRDGERRTLDLSAPGAGTSEVAYLIVQVVDDSGTVRDDAQVHLEGPLGTAEPLQSTQGSYAFLTAPGEQTLRVAAPGYAAIEKPVTLKGAKLADTAPQTVLVRLGHR